MTPDQILADDDDSDRTRSMFDRADNTARLALELAEAKREIARLHRDALAEAQAYRAMFARADIFRLALSQVVPANIISALEREADASLNPPAPEVDE